MVKVSFCHEDGLIEVPIWVCDLESFRRWADDDDFPEFAKISFLKNEVWVDMSKEQLFTHNQVKTEIAMVLHSLSKSAVTGHYFSDGAFVSNVEANIANQPDGCFVVSDSFTNGRAQVIEGSEAGHVEIEGSPDMVLEVVSRSSVRKDTIVLRQAYAEAGIREYWLVDARKPPLKFDILTLKDGVYATTRKSRGWLWSNVFAMWFRLTQAERDGFPSFSLETRPGKA